MIVGILGGFALWGELEEMDALSKWMFFLGCLISLVGVVILSTRKTNRGSSAGGDEASNAKSSSTSTRKDFEPSAYSSVTGNDTDDDAIELLSTRRSSSSSFDVVDRFSLVMVRGASDDVDPKARASPPVKSNGDAGEEEEGGEGGAGGSAMNGDMDGKSSVSKRHRSLSESETL